MVVPVADRKGHDRRYCLDDSLLRSMGYAPRIPFADGLKATVPGMPTTATGGSRSTGPRRPRDPPTAETSHEPVAGHGGQRDARP